MPFLNGTPFPELPSVPAPFREAGLTQEQLAEKIGTKKSFISRIENGRADIQISTLVKLFNGLGRQVSVRVL